MVRLPLTLLSVGVILIMATSPAFAEHVQCGDVITQDTTLDSDLVDCPGDGVVIGASGIALDLTGHTIDGTYVSGSHGVNDRGGHDDVTVTHGTIREFGASVDLWNQQGGELSHLVADDHISLRESPDIRIERNVVRRGIGVIGDSDRVLIRRNDVVDGGVILQGGFPPIGSPLERQTYPDNVIIDRNTIRPVMLLFQAPNASVTRNQVLGSPSDDAFAGIHIRGSPRGGTLADRNEVSGATIGILLSNTHAILKRNLVSDNATDGIQVVNTAFRPFPGIVVDRNRSERNGDDGIDVDVTGYDQQQPRELQRRLWHRGRAGRHGWRRQQGKRERQSGAVPERPL